MTTTKIPVLLTSSVIAYDADVALKDTDERIRLALESIEQWLRIEPSLNLVLCDGSSFDFTKIINKKFPLAKIECLYFENNQELVKRYGRGYGEGEIVRYAVQNSKFINHADCFAKCSSKLWVENFNQCIAHWNHRILLKGVFLNVFSFFKKTKFLHIDTRFYISSRQTYRKYFQYAHLQINQELGYGLEECFQEALLKNELKNSLFKINPIICGVGGGTGTYYKNSFKRKIKENIRIKLLRANKLFRHLYAK